MQGAKEKNWVGVRGGNGKAGPDGTRKFRTPLFVQCILVSMRLLAVPCCSTALLYIMCIMRTMCCKCLIIKGILQSDDIVCPCFTPF